MPWLGMLFLLPAAYSSWTHNPESAKLLVFHLGVVAFFVLVMGRGGEASRTSRRAERGHPIDVAVTFVVLTTLMAFMGSSQEARGLEYLILMGYQVLLYVLVSSLRLSESEQASVLQVWALSTLIPSLVALYQYVARVEIRNGVHWGSRATGTFIQPTFLAAFLSASLPVLVMLARSSSSGSRARKFHGVLCILALLALLLSLGRAGWLGAVAGLGVLVLIQRDLLHVLPVGRVVAGTSILVLLGVLFWSPLSQVERERLGLLSSPSTQERLYIWQGTLDMILEKPLTGWGPGAFGPNFPLFTPKELLKRLGREHKRAYFVHSELLHVAVERGLLGLLPWLALVFLTLRSLIRASDERTPRGRFHAVLLAAFVALLVNALLGLDARFTVSRFFFWMIVGLAALSIQGPQPVSHPEAGRDQGRAGGRRGFRWAAVALAGVVLLGPPLVLFRADRLKRLASELHFTARARAGQGGSLRGSPDLEAAEELFREARRLRPADHEVRFLRAHNLALLGRYEEAETAYADALEIDPYSTVILYNLVQLYRLMNRVDDARRALLLILEIDPVHEDAIHMLIELGGR